MKVDWDPAKARSNIRKHGVTFEEAISALMDFFSIVGVDPDHRHTEVRYITFGVSDRGRLLVVAHTEDDDGIRIISARLATRGEQRMYEEA